MKKKLHRQTQSSDCTQMAEALRVCCQFDDSIFRDASLSSNEWFFQVGMQFMELDGIEVRPDTDELSPGHKKELRDVAERLRLLAEMFDQFATGIDK